MRRRDVRVSESLGTPDLTEAKAEAARRYSGKAEARERMRGGGATLTEILAAYREMPKRCSERTAEANAQRLLKIVQVAWERKPEDVRASDLNERLWEDYAAARQRKGLKLRSLDISTRRAENRGINAAMRMAVSVFHEGLERYYERADINLDFEAARRVPWLPVIAPKVQPLAHESLEMLDRSLAAIKDTDRPLWRAVMIARHAGLRSKEINAARKSWLVHNKAGTLCFEIRDRPEEGFMHKTGEEYRAPILSTELMQDLLACPDDGPLVPVLPVVDAERDRLTRDHFFRKTCNNWLRAHGIARPHKGMHRLRALYAETLRDLTANLRLANDAGTEAAQEALGHTSDKTTKNHYLTQPDYSHALQRPEEAA